jgi:hypothetical protein
VKKILLVIAIAWVAGCASTLRPIVPATMVLRNYEVGQVMTAGVGEPIFDVQSAVAVPSFVVLRNHDPGMSQWGQVHRFPRLVAGDTLYAAGALGGDTLVVTVGGEPQWGRLAVMPDGSIVGFRSGPRWDGGEWPEERLLAPSVSLGGQAGAYRAQVVYSGVADGTVRAVFREFSGDFIRPAFSQELQYSVTQDSIIAYRSIRIRVLEATNTGIRYRILDDGDLQWLPAARSR